MARWIDAWMPGATVGPDGLGAAGHPGERFGLPAHGVSSVVGFGRRFLALAIDWGLGLLIAPLFSNPDPTIDPGHGWWVLGIWFLLTAVPVAIVGTTAGMVVLGIRVASIDSSAVIGVPRALLRTALIAVVIPPLVRDSDGRGWHDRATRTVVVRTRA